MTANTGHFFKHMFTHTNKITGVFQTIFDIELRLGKFELLLQSHYVNKGGYRCDENKVTEIPPIRRCQNQVTLKQKKTHHQKKTRMGKVLKVRN